MPVNSHSVDLKPWVVDIKEANMRNFAAHGGSVRTTPFSDRPEAYYTHPADVSASQFNHGIVAVPRIDWGSVTAGLEVRCIEMGRNFTWEKVKTAVEGRMSDPQTAPIAAIAGLYENQAQSFARVLSGEHRFLDDMDDWIESQPYRIPQEVTRLLKERLQLLHSLGLFE